MDAAGGNVGPPPAPTEPLSPGGFDSFRVEWTAADSQDIWYYEVEAYPTADPAAIVTRTTSELSFIFYREDLNISDPTETAEFRVRAINLAGEIGDWSSVGSIGFNYIEEADLNDFVITTDKLDDGAVTPIKTSGFTASRITVSDSSGVLASNAALTASRLVSSSGTGALASNDSLTTNRLTYADGAGSLASNDALTQNRVVIGDADGLPTPAAAITGSRALISDANGVPTHATLTSANLENVVHTVSDTTTVDLTKSSGTLSADVNRTPTALGYVYISSVTASSSASVTFTGLSTYDVYMVTICDVQPATDNVQFVWRASTDNGSSYISAASYNWAAAAVGSAATFVGAAGSGDTSVRLAGAMGNADNTEAGSFEFRLIHRGSGSSVSRVISQGTYRSAGADTLFYNVGGTYNAGAAVNAIQFLMSSGNITRGTFRLYGLKES